jgi:prevent-host-death family protein
MMRKVTIRETRGHFKLTVDDVTMTQDPVILEQNGQPMAVVMPIAAYEALRAEPQRLQQELEARLDELEERHAYLEARVAMLEEKLRRLMASMKRPSFRRIATAG